MVIELSLSLFFFVRFGPTPYTAKYTSANEVLQIQIGVNCFNIITMTGLRNAATIIAARSITILYAVEK